MSLAHSIGRLIRRAVAGFPEHYVTRLGVVVAIPDPPDEEKGTDRFRPRYAVDVQILTPDGEPDTSWPVLGGLPLPAHGGLYAFPEPGTLVRIGYDFGRPTHPYIADVLSEGQPAPAVKPGEQLNQQSDGAFSRFDAKGNWELRTDGEIKEDSHTRLIIGDEAVEEYGKLTRTIDGDKAETVGGSLDSLILGALVEKIGGDVRRAVLGGEESSTLGDVSRLVGGSWEMAVQQNATLKANLGNLLAEAVTGTATFKAAVRIVLDSIAVDLVLGATEPVILGNLFKTVYDAHTHAETGGNTGPPLVPMAATLLSTKVRAG